ncbi:MAG: LuxR C-terminal-related transcriptional regulator, partial [Armatimonadetes bacterium]|nr:LuxR C-terminal-related transcriptional regulator [Armatimonadota bacterium]
QFSLGREFLQNFSGDILEVIRALASGKSNKEIAAALGIREQTVKNHISHILEKLGLEDRLQIVVYAARHGLVSLDHL